MGEGSHLYKKKTRTTDNGLNENEKRTISNIEAIIRKDQSKEHTYTIDESGSVLYSADGEPNQVVARAKKDTIVTHNHPRETDSNYDKGI